MTQAELTSPHPGGRLRAIIEAALERARRRRLRYLLGIGLTVALVVVAVVLLNREQPNPGGSAVVPEPVAASAVLRGDPYMGIACSSADAWSCDRIGLSVTLKAPASRVSAEIGGKQFSLDDPGWSGRLRNGVSQRFAGFLDPAGMREQGPLHVLRARPGKDKWIGPAQARFPVELTIHRADGSVQTTKTKLWLAPGWG